jgi:F0F1-type ATP synthase assembly protein I
VAMTGTNERTRIVRGAVAVVVGVLIGALLWRIAKGEWSTWATPVFMLSGVAIFLVLAYARFLSTQRKKRQE